MLDWKPRRPSRIAGRFSFQTTIYRIPTLLESQETESARYDAHAVTAAAKRPKGLVIKREHAYL
jgi:hypothetical protein